jgi:hypothetical protein
LDFGQLVAGFEKYVEAPLLGAAFTVGSVGVFVTCAGAVGWTGVGIGACGLAGVTMLSVGLGYDYASYREVIAREKHRKGQK